MRRQLASVLTRSGSGIRPAGVMGLVAVDVVMGVVFGLPVASRHFTKGAEMSHMAGWKRELARRGCRAVTSHVDTR